MARIVTKGNYEHFRNSTVNLFRLARNINRAISVVNFLTGNTINRNSIISQILPNDSHRQEGNVFGMPLVGRTASTPTTPIGGNRELTARPHVSWNTLVDNTEHLDAANYGPVQTEGEIVHQGTDQGTNLLQRILTTAGTALLPTMLFGSNSQNNGLRLMSPTPAIRNSNRITSLGSEIPNSWLIGQEIVPYPYDDALLVKIGTEVRKAVVQRIRSSISNCWNNVKSACSLQNLPELILCLVRPRILLKSAAKMAYSIAKLICSLPVIIIWTSLRVTFKHIVRQMKLFIYVSTRRLFAI